MPRATRKRQSDSGSTISIVRSQISHTSIGHKQTWSHDNYEYDDKQRKSSRDDSRPRSLASQAGSATGSEIVHTHVRFAHWEDGASVCSGTRSERSFSTEQLNNMYTTGPEEDTWHDEAQADRAGGGWGSPAVITSSW